MPDDDTTTQDTSSPQDTGGSPEAAAPRARRTRARKATAPVEPAVAPPADAAPDQTDGAGDAPAAPKRRRATRKAAAPAETVPAADAGASVATDAEPADAPAPRRRRATKKAVPAVEPVPVAEVADAEQPTDGTPADGTPAVETPPSDGVSVDAGRSAVGTPQDELADEETPEPGDATDAVTASDAATAESQPAEPVAVAPRRAPITSAEPIRMKPLTPEALLAAVERGRRRAAAAQSVPTAPDAPDPGVSATPASVAAAPTPNVPPADADVTAPAVDAPGTTAPITTAPVTPDDSTTALGTPDQDQVPARDPRFRRRGEPGHGEVRTDRSADTDARASDEDAGATDGDDQDAAPARRPQLAPLFVDADQQPRTGRRRGRSRGGEQNGGETGGGGRRPAADGAPSGPDQLLERLVAHAPGESAPTSLDAGNDTGPDDSGVGVDDADDESGARRKRRRRGGRGRRRVADDGSEGGSDADATVQLDDDEESVGDVGTSSDADTRDVVGGDADQQAQEAGDDEEQAEGGTRRRRRRRRRGGEGTDSTEGTEETASDESVETTVRVREPRRRRTREGHEDEVTPSRGSTRLEAKKIRRKEGRDANKRRPPILSEAEFLARRESVGRTMLVRESAGRTQIAVLEDDILVEHYIAENASNSERSMIGDVYLGRVQNVLPAMEAAFIDIGHGRNGVLYAGEVNWDGAGLDGKPKRIELALKSGQPVLVQVTKDPIGHKGARLTAQISLAGRYLVYVPNGSMSGISRKLPDTERARLKKILKELIPSDAGVIVRTAAEGATEAELTGDVERLKEQWAAISKKAKGSAPNLLQGEPDLAVKVVRDIFNSDFTRLVVTGDAVRDEVVSYVRDVAPTLVDRVETWSGDGDLFAAHRVDEQLAKALERKVFLPSGGSLVIDRTEAMTVVDVNTGRFTGSGGNLEETVTENNLEAAEELVRQLRLRDIGGIIVVDFIDMVFESNRDLVIRRLVECLGRDRTRHQVAEVSSLGLVQMTRKRIGRGLLEVFGHPCETCKGRGVVVDLDGVHDHEVPEPRAVPGRAPNPGNTGRLHSAKVAAGGVPTNGGESEVDVTTDELDGGAGPVPETAPETGSETGSDAGAEAASDAGTDGGTDGGSPVDQEAELVVAGHPS